MITSSRCPAVLYPLTFPSEENSQWTAAEPSQVPFLLPSYGPVSHIRKPNRLKQLRRNATFKILYHFTIRFFTKYVFFPSVWSVLLCAEQTGCDFENAPVNLFHCLPCFCLSVPAEMPLRNAAFCALCHTIMHKYGSTHPWDENYELITHLDKYSGFTEIKYWIRRQCLGRVNKFILHLFQFVMWVSYPNITFILCRGIGNKLVTGPKEASSVLYLYKKWGVI